MSATALPQNLRSRELGIPFDGITGTKNSILDVKGVEVGHSTIIEGKAVPGDMKAAHTGVTIIFPRGKKIISGVPGATFSLNGNGEMTGISWIDESGLIEGPIGLTNTLSVGVVRDSITAWIHKKFPKNLDVGMLPVVAETDDSWLNDPFSYHVKKSHVLEAIDNANSQKLEEGAVGAGTGTVTFGFKAGIGTSSRKTEAGYTVGVLVQSNFGRREELSIRGIPLGKHLTKSYLPIEHPTPKRDGSIIVVVATDAPLLPHQMKRLTKRVGMGLARTGSFAHNSSGDIFIAFSTAVPKENKLGLQTWTSLKNENMDELFKATVEATEESILNALVAAKDSVGINGNKYFALPHSVIEGLSFDHLKKQ